MASPETILIVDDDDAIHELLKAVLSSAGWRTQSAGSGEEALNLIRANNYGLVLTDIHMPGIDGLELLRRIRQVRPSTKVIVMTGDSTSEHLLTSLRDLAFSYFSKPFQISDVVDTIEQAFRTPEPDDGIELLSASPNWVSLRVRCRLDVADRLVQYFVEIKTDLLPKDREDVATAFREMLRNAIEHGGKLDPTQRVHVAFVRTSRAILYYIRDPGEGFNMEQLPHAAISYPEDKPTEHILYRTEHGLRPGGFGILLVRNLVDELIYNEQGNEVLMIKYLT